MAQSILTTLLAASLLVAGGIPSPARGNAMGYQLLTAQRDQCAAQQPRSSLGMDVERSQAIIDGGMTFDIKRIKQVRHGSPGARAGFEPGDSSVARKEITVAFGRDRNF